MRRTILIPAVLAVVLAACGGQQADSGVDTGLERADTTGAPTAAEDNSEQPAAREIVTTASIELSSADTRATMAAISELVVASDGFVSAQTVAPVDEGQEHPVVTMTLRVPAEDLARLLVAIGKLADEVVTDSLTTEDVTEEYVDLEARLRNLAALEDELRALLTEMRKRPDADPDKLLRIFTEIGTVRGQIEQIEGRRQYLSNRVNLATITVTLRPLPETAALVDEGWRPGIVAREALRSLVAAMQQVTNGAIWLVLYVAPLLVVVGVPVWVILRFSRRKRPAPAGDELPKP